MARSRVLTVWLPVLAWAAVIFAFSSIPSLSSGLGVWDTVLRKGAHITEYAVLGALLYRALGLMPPSFYHCPLVTDPSGVRLAKRHDALSLRSLRSQGVQPEQLREHRASP